MKKILIVILAVCSCTISKAQFTVTPSGVRSVADTSKVYVVIQHQGSSTEENNSIINELSTRIFTAPRTDIRSAKNNTITINSSAEFNNVKIKGNPFQFIFTIEYSIVYSFKEDRVKMNLTTHSMALRNPGVNANNPNAVMPVYFTPQKGMSWLGNAQSLFNKSEKPIVGAAGIIELIESYFNKIAADTADAIQKKEVAADEDNW